MSDRYDNRWHEAKRDHAAAVRREEEGEHDDECDCPDCSEAAWDRLQEAQAESPSEWNQAYKGPIDKLEMRRNE